MSDFKQNAQKLEGTWKLKKHENFKEYIKPYDPIFSNFCCGWWVLLATEKESRKSKITISNVSDNGCHLVYSSLGKDTIIPVRLGEHYSYTEPHSMTTITETCRYEEMTKTMIRDAKHEKYSEITRSHMNSAGEMVVEATNKWGTRYTAWYVRC